MNNESVDREFIAYALKFFKELKWKPARPEDLSAPHIIVYGNLDKQGRGTVCVIDPVSRLFKIELNQRSNTDVIKTMCVVNYQNSKEAIMKFEHYMDSVGGFYKDAWLKM